MYAYESQTHKNTSYTHVGLNTKTHRLLQQQYSVHCVPQRHPMQQSRRMAVLLPKNGTFVYSHVRVCACTPNTPIVLTDANKVHTRILVAVVLLFLLAHDRVSIEIGAGMYSQSCPHYTQARTSAYTHKPSTLTIHHTHTHTHTNHTRTHLRTDTNTHVRVALLAPGSTPASPAGAVCAGAERHQGHVAGPGDSGAHDWDVRVGPLREVDSDMGKDTLRAFRLQIGGSFNVRATTLVYPIDYSRDHRGRYIIYTTPRDVHEAVVGVKPALLSESLRAMPDGQRAS